MSRVHRVHDILMRPNRALAGVGVYVLGQRGHARAFPMPDVIADDEWVHRSFAVHERRVVAEARSTVRPAPSLQAHLRRRIRVRLGNKQLAALGRPAQGPSLRLTTLAGLVSEGTISPLDAVCFLAVTAVDRIFFAFHRSTDRSDGWTPERSAEKEPIPQPAAGLKPARPGVPARSRFR